MSKREATLYLADMNDAILKIERYVRGLSFEAFIKEDKTIDAVIRNIIIIGEAANNMPHAVKKAHADIAWHKVIGMRNKVTHEYFGVDEEILWKTIQTDIPVLKKQIAALLKVL